MIQQKMSLEDKFYPEDGSNLTRFDNFMIKSAGKIGEVYQHATGKSYKEFSNSCYKTSAGGFVLGTLCFQISAPILLLNSISRIKSPNYESPLEEEIRLEAQYKPRKFNKLCRAAFLALAPLIAYTNYDIFVNVIEKNESFLSYFASGGIIYGISLLPFNFAEYLTKADVPKPPKKTILKRAKEKLMSLDPQLPQVLKPQPSNYASNTRLEEYIN